MALHQVAPASSYDSPEMIAYEDPTVRSAYGRSASTRNKRFTSHNERWSLLVVCSFSFHRYLLLFAKILILSVSTLLQTSLWRILLLFGGSKLSYAGTKLSFAATKQWRRLMIEGHHRKRKALFSGLLWGILPLTDFRNVKSFHLFCHIKWEFISLPRKPIKRKRLLK